MPATGSTVGQAAGLARGLSGLDVKARPVLPLRASPFSCRLRSSPYPFRNIWSPDQPHGRPQSIPGNRVPETLFGWNVFSACGGRSFLFQPPAGHPDHGWAWMPDRFFGRSYLPHSECWHAAGTGGSFRNSAFGWKRAMSKNIIIGRWQACAIAAMVILNKRGRRTRSSFRA